MILTEERLTQAILAYDTALMDSLPDPRDCDHVFSEAFERKMKKLIRRANHFAAYKILRYAASIFIAFILSASMFLAFNPEARATVVGWVKEQFQGVYHYFFAAENETEQPETYALTWVPDGYKLESFIETPTLGNSIYLNDGGEMLYFVYMYGSDAVTLTAGWGDYETRQIRIGELYTEMYLALDSNESNAIAWEGNDDKVIFHISGFVQEEDLIKMAQSVVAKK